MAVLNQHVGAWHFATFRCRGETESLLDRSGHERARKTGRIGRE
jgi:hypothetical protein